GRGVRARPDGVVRVRPPGVPARARRAALARAGHPALPARGRQGPRVGYGGDRARAGSGGPRRDGLEPHGRRAPAGGAADVAAHLRRGAARPPAPHEASRARRVRRGGLMRVYLPTTVDGLAAAYEAGAFATPPLDAHAVTPAIREWYVSGDLEELEYVALTDAAEASLRLLAAAGTASFRRVVVAADVPDTAVRPRHDDLFRSAVTVLSAVPLEDVASVHVDEPEAAD